LPQPFIRLPLQFDAERLQEEVAALPASAWAMHPNEIEGNSSVRLISVDGGENDDVNGVMMPTAHLHNSPYIRQLLAGFAVVWGRSRLMRLAPGAEVPQHSDINYHWFSRVRLHIPVITRPAVRFYCDEQDVHMAAGEAWLFDNWRPHRVINPTSQERIHLVADTSGTAAFWQFALSALGPGQREQLRAYQPGLESALLTERTLLRPVMSPAEVEFLLLDLRAELATPASSPEQPARIAHLHAVLEGFCKDWRQLYLLHGEEPSGWNDFTRLRDGLREIARDLADGLITRSNRVGAFKVLEGRVLRAALSLPESAPAPAPESASAPAPSPAPAPAPAQSPAPRLERPVFIIAAPRSGSTLLFETLAASAQLATLGGEAHWLVESIEELQLGAPGVESNRLLATHATPAVAARIMAQIAARLVDAGGNPVAQAGSVRLLEKTPKNALRIPFFGQLFPDALFVFLWRDPRDNLSSIMDAWQSGRLKTYNGLEGFDGPWSMLLPPGWPAMQGRPLEVIAAFQWETTNRVVLDDLGTLPRERWTSLSYAELIADPAHTMRRLCQFIGVEADSALVQRASGPLPLSRYTLTPPAADKWRRNEAAIRRVLPAIDATWQRLKALA
jgi:LPS sulfotransferase NodH